MSDATKVRAEAETPAPAETGHKAKLRALYARWRQAEANRIRVENLKNKLDRKEDRLLAIENAAEQALADYLITDLDMIDEVDDMDFNAPLILLDGVALQFHKFKSTKGDWKWAVNVLPIKGDV